MRHLLGLVILLFVAGIGLAIWRSAWMAHRHQRRGAVRGMRIRIPSDSSSDEPTNLKED
jgi:hypothetical protein